MIPVEANQLFYFLGSLGAMLWIFNQGRSAFGKKEPLQRLVSLVEPFASKEELKGMEEKREQQFLKLEVKLEDGQRRIHERIDALGITLTDSVAELRGELRRIKT